MTDKPRTLQHDMTFHVAQLLQEPVGATRQYQLALEVLQIDEELTARALEASVKLTRIPAGILAAGTVQASVTLTCMRCLEPFEQAVQADFADEYRPTIDIFSGVELATDDTDEEEYFAINGMHLLDIGESLRQGIVLALPMAPHCRADCPGLPEASAGDDESGDERFAALGQLLTTERERGEE